MLSRICSAVDKGPLSAGEGQSQEFWGRGAVDPGERTHSIDGSALVAANIRSQLGPRRLSPLRASGIGQRASGIGRQVYGFLPTLGFG